MVDKSNEYGYVPSSPTQARGANTGIFEVNDVVDLLNAQQWSGDFGRLELIETKTISSVSSAIFTSIQESTYNVHFMTVNDFQVTNDNQRIFVRFFENGVEESASVYQTANQLGQASGSFSEQKSTAQDHIRFVTSTGSATAESGNGYMYFYNLGDSSKYSFTTMHSTTLMGAPDYFMEFGSGVLPQASTVDQIKLYVSAGTFNATASLYGIAES